MNKKAKAGVLGGITLMSAGIIGVGTLLALRTSQDGTSQGIVVESDRKLVDTSKNSNGKDLREIVKLKKEIAKLKNELDATMKSFDKLFKEGKQSNDLNLRTIKDLFNKLNKSNENLDISESARKALMESFNKLMNESKQSKELNLKTIKDLLNKLNSIATDAKDKDHIIKELKKRIDNLLVTNTKLQENLKSITNDRNMIKDELGKANEEKAQLIKEKKFLENANQGLMKDVAKATAKIDKLTSIGKLLEKFNKLVLQRGEVYANLLVNKRNLGSASVHDPLRKFYERKSKEFQGQFDKLTNKINEIQSQIAKLKATVYSAKTIYNISA